MKKWRIIYNPKYTPTPLSYWVHQQVDDEVWMQATVFDPPIPRGIPGKGFPLLLVHVLGVELEFASIPEVEHMLVVFRQKNMPTSRQLSRQRADSHGPNSHRLSRLPASIKPWSKRARIIPVLEDALKGFRALY